MSPADRDGTNEIEDTGVPDQHDQTIELPISDVLDLHGFVPREIRDVVRTYLDEAWAAGFAGARLIHGKGIGVQREAVRKILAADPRVASFADAAGGGGGWGATVLSFRRPET